MKWTILPKVSDDIKLQLLNNRGLSDPQQIEEFLHPDLTRYEADLKLEGIPPAVERIQRAIDQKEQIVVYGDYDVDGVSATAITYKALSSLGADILPFIPHRDRDGYGLSKSGMDAIKEKYPTTKLVITVDNGVVAIEQAKYAKSIGFDLIITDHHLPLDTKPEAVAIVHSTKMCGAAVAWCLARVMVSKELAEELLQLAAIGTVADQMTLVGLGRALAVDGLKILNRTQNPGLRALIYAASLEFGRIGAYEIGHIIAPKLNAAGRMDTAMPALKLLCTNKPSRAVDLARELMQANTSRQDLTSRAIEEAGLQIDKTHPIHVVASSAWISGIIGLVAARLTDEHAKPSIAISIGESIAKGSARSVPGINIVESLRLVRDVLIDVGGHEGAAGFSLEPGRVEEFKQRLVEVMLAQKIEVAEKELTIEAEVERKHLKMELVDLMDEFEPFGQGNPKPILATRSMKLTDIKTVGGGKHLKFKADGIDAIAFSMGNQAAVLQEGQVADVAYMPEINRFNGRSSLQLKVKDIV